MPEILLSENSRVIIPIATLIIVIGFVITATFTFTTWKSQTEAKDKAMELKISEMQKYDEKQDIKIEKLENATIDINISVKAIETDVKWLRAYMEDRVK